MNLKRGQVVRLRDLMELFDTTPDLTGHDTDVSRFIRDDPEREIFVFWRDLPTEGPPPGTPGPSRDELCPVPIGDMRELVKKNAGAWSLDDLEGVWSPLKNTTLLVPGMQVMLSASDGRYDPSIGWDPKATRHVPVIAPASTEAPDAHGRDRMSEASWMSIIEHTDDVVAMVTGLGSSIGLANPWHDALLSAARWHDVGKVHPSFQAKADPSKPVPSGKVPFAKYPKESARPGWPPLSTSGDDPRRRHFRHEVASGLLALQHGQPDLVTYLAAAHHGKVRLSLRSVPDEPRPPEVDRRFARGVWHGDDVPPMDLGGGVSLPLTTLDLSVMDLGEGPSGPSWLARMIALRDSLDIGPMRLAYLEALMKASDERASGGLP